MLCSMKYVEASGVRLSAIGLGTWQFGAREWGYGRQYAQRDAIAIVRRALDLGVNLIDTAELYAFGNSERIVGQAIKERRSEAFIATKIFPILPIRQVVRRRCAASRRRLAVDHTDLYQVHWPNPIVPIAWTMDGMRDLLDNGATLHAGVSNFSLDRWRQAEELLGRPILSNQVRCSLVDRRPLANMAPWARKHDRIVIAYSPLGQGLLSAKYGPTNPPPDAVRKANPLFLPVNLERASGLLDTLRDIADAHDAKPAQIALAWLIQRPNVVVIPGAHSIEQVEGNVQAATIDLTKDEDEALTRAAEAFTPITGPNAMIRLAHCRVTRK